MGYTSFMKNLSLMSKDELLNHAKSLAQEEQRISILLVECLRECERRMLYAEMGFSSLWDFAVRCLGLSESSAQLRIGAMRLARQNEQVMDHLRSGELSLSNASQLYSFFQTEKKSGKSYSSETREEIIQEMIGVSKKECEKKLVALSPEALPKEKERPLTETKTELRIVLDNSILAKLQKLRDHLAHSLPQATHTELIEYLIHEALEKLEKKRLGKEPKKANEGDSLRPEMVIESVNHCLSPQQNEEPTQGPLLEIVVENPIPAPRTYIPVADRRWAWNRSGNQCEFISQDGIRCSCTYGLQIDHITPLALGGKSDRVSLRVLCRNHNILEGIQHLGRHRMKPHVPSLK